MFQQGMAVLSVWRTGLAWAALLAGKVRLR
jgi:hypothetical protein